MARARNIKPGLFKNEILGQADPLLTLLFEGLWLLADREGRMQDRPLRIKAEVFPYRAGLDACSMLDWLHKNGFIRRYTVAGVRYLSVCEFTRHQNPHKNEPPSDIPPPEQSDVNQEMHDAAPEKIGSASEEIGSARADSLIPDSLIPDSLSEEAKASSSSAGAPTCRPRQAESQVPCPYEKIVEAYHEALPSLPRVRMMDDKRKKAMRQRWGWVFRERREDGRARATNGVEALAWFLAFFERASHNDWLMGRRPSKDYPDFKADFDFLLRDSGWKAVIERTEAAA